MPRNVRHSLLRSDAKAKADQQNDRAAGKRPACLLCRLARWRRRRFEQGKKDAQTNGDYISYDMEHAPFDVAALAEYMRGLKAGGPTRSGA
jgi:hypothetical protein